MFGTLLTLRANGEFPHLIVLLPRSPRQRGWGALPDRLTRDGLTFLDLSFLTKEFTQEQYVPSSFDPHPGAAVHHRIGEELADYVRNNAWKFRATRPTHRGR
jgi:hypothetical protein